MPRVAGRVNKDGDCKTVLDEGRGPDKGGLPRRHATKV